MAALAAVILTTYFLFDGGGWLKDALGDTDDATRIVFVRELLHGRGWFDQHFLRYQPPVGTYFHWSRLLDGAIAGLVLAFRAVVDPERAELAARVVWPGIWIFVAIWASLWAVRGLSAGEGAAAEHDTVAATSFIALFGGALYQQFHPGRVDHHNVQIALTVIAFAAALQARQARYAPIIGGIAAGLGLAIGLEALVFQALIGGFIALRFLSDAREDRFVGQYAMALLATVLIAYALQTPPDRLSLSACDAIGANLVAGAATGAILLWLSVKLTARRSLGVRASALALSGGAALLVYFALHPSCIHGPFADVDMRIRSFWLDHVSEVANIGFYVSRQGSGALFLIAPGIMAGLATGILLGSKPRREAFGWRLTATLLLVALCIGASAIRMSAYCIWVALPVLGVASVRLARRFPLDLGLVGVIAAAILLTPTLWSAAGAWVWETVVALRAPAVKSAPAIASKPGTRKPSVPPTRTKPVPPPDYCFNAFPYAELAKSPKGLTVSEIDLGPFVVAYTPSSTLSAPYHRLGWGIMAARSILTAPEDRAHALIANYGVTYVLECPGHSGHADRTGLASTALQRRLDRGDVPNWLTRLSKPNSPVVVYQVTPLKTKLRDKR